jgi:2-polyprenyl-3-methyl-5-hydroxy-6-metoxy-1,4-benzoquinol methylase
MADADLDNRRPAQDWEEHWSAYEEATKKNPAQRYRRKLLFRALSAGAAQKRVIDLGCGQGDFLREAARELPDAELVGIDLSETGLAIARKKSPDVRFFRSDFSQAEALPAELQGWATHVVCSEILEHLDEPRDLLRAVKRLLAPEGLLVITVPSGPRSAFDVHIGHRRHYSPTALARLVEQAGYATCTLTGAGFPFFNLYKLTIILRGRKLAQDISGAEHGPRLTGAAALVMAGFDRLFAFNRDRSRFGWQTFGVFRSR